MQYLIDSHDITNYNRSTEELQLFWLFCVLVAGKNSDIQARKLSDFLTKMESTVPGYIARTPFQYIEWLYIQGQLEDAVKAEKLGQYSRIIPCFVDSLKFDLEYCTLFGLESIHGVGPKTSRFFLLHSRPDQNYAVLDTHILRWMREELNVDTPKNTPSRKRYLELEQIYLEHCERNELSPAELDLEIWSRYNRQTV
jgi:thermostable 8-oxoguanine DNA glycosylase